MSQRTRRAAMRSCLLEMAGMPNNVAAQIRPEQMLHAVMMLMWKVESYGAPSLVKELQATQKCREQEK